MSDDYLDNIHHLNLQRLLDIIIEYRENLPEPNMGWPKADFDNASYSIWAADEIIKAIMTHPEKTVGQVIEDFKYSMSKGYTAYMRFPSVQTIFNVGYSVASDIDDILYAYGEVI